LLASIIAKPGQQYIKFEFYNTWGHFAPINRNFFYLIAFSAYFEAIIELRFEENFIASNSNQFKIYVLYLIYRIVSLWKRCSNKESISSCVKLVQLNFEILIIHWIQSNIFETIVRIKVFIVRQLIIIKIATNQQQKLELNLIIINNIQLNCLSLV
jgi:hypothetical protein